MNKSITKHFDNAAEFYNQHANVQKEIATKLIDVIPLGLNPKRILEIACGTGFLTKKILEKFPNTNVDAIDISKQMINVTKREMGSVKNLLLKVADAQNYKSESKYDLILSSASFHWLSNLEKAFANFREMLSVNGLMIFSVMLEGTFKELHLLRKELFPNKIPKTKLPNFEHIIEILRKTNFTIEKKSDQEIKQYHNNSDEFFSMIKKLGLIHPSG